jgi:hypothetical protein
MTRPPDSIVLPLVTDPPEVPLYAGHLTGRLEEHLRLVSRNRLAETVTGGLSRPGKMPCPSIGLPAKHCRVGSELAKVEGSVCHPSVCYAKQRNYKRQGVQDKLDERYEGLFHELWTPSMIFLINYHCDRYFRWFDSGDIASASHLKNMLTVARFTPDVLHWCPSREITTIRDVTRELLQAGLAWPENFRVRVSSPMVDGAPLPGFTYTSTVVSNAADATCIAQRQKNKCDGEVDNCRACWEKEGNVSYPLH